MQKNSDGSCHRHSKDGVVSRKISANQLLPQNLLFGHAHTVVIDGLNLIPKKLTDSKDKHVTIVVTILYEIFAFRCY